MCFRLIGCVSSQLFNNSELTTNSGIFYDHIGSVQFFANSWKLITYLDISNIDSKLTLAESIFSRTEKLCNQESLVNFLSCSSSIKILKQILPEISEKQNTLKDLTGHKRRYKRGWFNGVGTVFKTVFGVLDADDAKTYNDAINELDKDEKQAIKILKDQTNVIKTTISNFNSTITNFQRNEEIFNKNLIVIEQFSRDTTKQLFDINIKQKIDEHLETLILMINEIDKEITDLISAILLTKRNVLHPRVITPKQFMEELGKTLISLPVGTKYPFPLDIENFNIFAQVLKLKLFLIESKCLCL